MALLDDQLRAYADAIASIESSGRYDLVGPRHARYGRALGRYQVMESNLPEWLRAAGWPETMTPEQFLANPAAQDAVFQHRFGQYVQRHGPEGAAAAWFAGEGGMNNPGARDSLGTSVASYRQRFNAALGGGTPPTRDAAPVETADATAPTEAPAAQSTGGGLLSGVFGAMEGQNASGPFASLYDTNTTSQQPSSSDQAARARLAAESAAEPDALNLTAPQTPQLDLTRLRALLQGRGRLGTMRG